MVFSSFKTGAEHDFIVQRSRRCSTMRAAHQSFVAESRASARHIRGGRVGWHGGTRYLRPTASCAGQGISTASAYRPEDSLHEQPLLQLPLSSASARHSPPPPPSLSSSSSPSSHHPRSRRHCSAEQTNVVIIIDRSRTESVDNDRLL